MQDWKQILKIIYTPELGSLWAVPNKIWDNGFASNKTDDQMHPAILEKISICKSITYLIPGTSKSYNQGSCVFKLKLNSLQINAKESYFLIKLSMPFTKEKLLELSQGWDGIEVLNEKQMNDFKLQLKFCKG